MKLLTVEEFQPVPTPELLTIAEFAALVRRDRGSKGDSQGRKKQRASRELAFIYFMENVESTYLRTYEDEEQRAEVLYKDLFLPELEGWTEDDVVKDARLKYRELTRDQTVELLVSTMHLLTRTKKFFDSVDFTVRDEEGRPKYNAKEVFDMVGKVGPMLAGFRKLYEEALANLQSGSRTRGGFEANEFSE